MENENSNIENLLDSQHASLTRAKKDILWDAIEADISMTPIPSPFLFSFLHTKNMVPLALVFILLFGAGSTVAASEMARPGDLLFPVDQALEEVRLALASNDEARASLQLRFAEERIEELRSLLSDATSPSDDSPSQTSTTTPGTAFEVEADVFTDVTIVKVEINGHTTTFETSADTRDEVIAEIVRRYSLAEADVAAILDFEVEDRASRVSERVDAGGNEDVETSLTLLEALLLGIGDDDRDRMISEALDSFGDDIEIEVREKDGEVRIKIDDDSDDDSDTDQGDDHDSDDERDDDSRDDSNHTSSNTQLEAEADVFTDVTIVKVEINGHTTTFETSADTRDEVIAEIVRRYSLAEADVAAILDFEVEDRASRTEDMDDDSLDDTSDDNTDDDGSDDGNDDSDDNSSSSDDSGDISDDAESDVKIEARVEDGSAEVRVEYGTIRDEFEVAYTTEAALVAAIASRSGLSTTVVSESLDLEIED